MTLDWQSLLVVLALAGASACVGKSIHASIRPRTGCSSCQHNKTRTDDYV